MDIIQLNKLLNLSIVVLSGVKVEIYLNNEYYVMSKKIILKFLNERLGKWDTNILYLQNTHL